MARGKGITFAEDQAILLGLQNGKTVPEIAKFLNRSFQAVYKRVDRMKANGEFDQIVADLGQLDD